MDDPRGAVDEEDTAITYADESDAGADAGAPEGEGVEPRAGDGDISGGPDAGDPAPDGGAEGEAAPSTDAEAPADADAASIDADSPGDADEGEEDAGPGPGADLTDEQLVERAAALLFASPEPLSLGKLVSLLERPPKARVQGALTTLGASLDGGPLPVQLRGLKGGYTLMTVPEVGEVVGRLAKGNPVERISPAALETLAIVAYRQPVTKAEIEAIRGVQAGPILRSLVDRALVKVTGRADVPGHPLQYGTTKDFLDRFGLMGLDELPRDAELARD